jgi:hypothetical protein
LQLITQSYTCDPNSHFRGKRVCHVVSFRVERAFGMIVCLCMELPHRRLGRFRRWTEVRGSRSLFCTIQLAALLACATRHTGVAVATAFRGLAVLMLIVAYMAATAIVSMPICAGAGTSP